MLDLQEYKKQISDLEYGESINEIMSFLSRKHGFDELNMELLNKVLNKIKEKQNLEEISLSVLDRNIAESVEHGYSVEMQIDAMKGLIEKLTDDGVFLD